MSVRPSVTTAFTDAVLLQCRPKWQTVYDGKDNSKKIAYTKFN